jgi:nitrite reductase (NO-forming)/hydroxylamine reductase
MRLFRRSTTLGALLALGMGLPLVAIAQERAKPGVTATEMQYQAGDSPLGKVDMHQNINPKAPPMTKAEFEKAKEHLLPALRRLSRRAAQGCHRQAA